MRRFYSICLLLLFGCNLEVNTAGPQASKSIYLSKASKLFLKEYRVTSDGPCQIRAAWLENTWRNEIENEKVQKLRLGTNQLVLSLDPTSAGFDRNEYLISWKLTALPDATLGSRNGVYTLRLKSDSMPDTFAISLTKMTLDIRPICTFQLKALPENSR